MLDEVTKKCPKCKTFKALNYAFWSKDSSRKDGFDWKCKICKNATENVAKRKIRDARRIAKDGKKIKAREEAKKIWSAKDFTCRVLGCYNPAKHLHHVDYDKPTEVIPLCEKHHVGIHDCT